MSHNMSRKMYSRLTILFLIITYIAVCDGNTMNNLQEKNRMVGVDTIHDIRIDKDTIISRNLKLENKHRGWSGEI
uniref:Odorant binding protein n=1 Tax=Eogystia hippophaecolus TaxID=1206364 RepID=A0A1B3P5I0_EOGHI|nr:odorant binding protein [Eogystia hippophaecolus]